MDGIKGCTPLASPLGPPMMRPMPDADADMGRAPRFTFMDLFAGVGGFHLAMAGLGGSCVLAVEIDHAARAAYEANFRAGDAGLFEAGLFPADVREVRGDFLFSLARADVLCAGFPCQPFSQAGRRLGFDDPDRGNLFRDIVRIAGARRPRALLLENVAHIVGHDGGRTIARIEATLRDLGYSFELRVIRASDHGLPQHRPRAFMVGFDLSDPACEAAAVAFAWPDPEPLAMSMRDVWGARTCDREVGYTLRVGGRNSPHGDRHNWDSYLVDGAVRRLGPVQGRAMMGFPPHHVLGPGDAQAMKQLGNSVAVPVVRAVGRRVLLALGKAA